MVIYFTSIIHQPFSLAVCVCTEVPLYQLRSSLVMQCSVVSNPVVCVIQCSVVVVCVIQCSVVSSPVVCVMQCSVVSSRAVCVIQCSVVSSRAVCVIQCSVVVVCVIQCSVVSSTVVCVIQCSVVSSTVVCVIQCSVVSCMCLRAQLEQEISRDEDRLAKNKSAQHKFQALLNQKVNKLITFALPVYFPVTQDVMVSELQQIKAQLKAKQRNN